ncbi:MAG: lytic transglycosylase domain-containing protein [Oscillospiraceae bacterium]|nr:lytic transglycosylase domain-containing protein [Oscillospiraceae bacterium]
MTNKLDIPAIATVSLLDVVKIAHPEQMGEPSPIWDVPLTDEEMTALLETCEAGQIHPSIGLGLIQVESSFRPDALNTASGCYGYCQLNPKYFPSDLAPADNIRTGMEYLAYQLERYDGDLEAALTAYNAGHDTGDRTYADMVITAAATFRG